MQALATRVAPERDRARIVADIGMAVSQLRFDKLRAGSVSSELIRELLVYLEPLRERELSAALRELHLHGLRLPARIAEDGDSLNIRAEDLTKILKALLEERQALAESTTCNGGVPSAKQRAVPLGLAQEALLQRAGMLARRQVLDATRPAVDEADDWRRCVALMQAHSAIPKGSFVVDLSEDEFLYNR